MQPKDHWDRVYTTKPADSVSWFQAHAERSLRLIHETGVSKSAPLIDVGGGASTLFDDLLGDGYTNLTVLDISEAALEAARKRVGQRFARVCWLQADVTTAIFPPSAYEVWHDRAVFHFLTAPEQRLAYVQAVIRAVKPGGHVIVATFAEDGPTECSGLPIRRYSPAALHAEFGPPFELIRKELEDHQTPFGTIQKFIYCYCRKAVSERFRRF